jgi:uncharacterized protein YyaL (SSP411 family)
MQDIRWRGWSDAPFEESKRTGKPVLLSISAVWCHWCHVMDETTYSTPRVVEIINERFIPVRVDTDRNPDINARYNMGGWPTTAFLTHDRDVIAGATYVPPDQMAGILERAADAYSKQGEMLAQQAKQARIDGEERLSNPSPGRPGLADVERVLAGVRSGYDREYGGFGFDQKFPFTDALALLLVSYEYSGERRDLDLVTGTLDGMIHGELFDRIEGGMFRYATVRDWTEPHYEKILEDNARIASVLLDTYRITGGEHYLDTARGVFSYVENTLLDRSTGLFLGSQDADGEYYRADQAARKLLERPRVDRAAYTDSNADMASAYLKLWAVTGEPSARERATRIVSFLNSLPRDADGTVPHYHEDNEAREHGILADHAGLILANVECHEATGDRAYLDEAVELCAHLGVFGSESGGLYDISERRARARGLGRHSYPLDENSTAATAIAKLGVLTGEPTYLETAERILSVFAGQYEDYGIMAASYGMAVIAARRDPLVVTVRARGEDPARDRFLEASMRSCNSLCTVRLEESEEDEQPGAIVCVGSNCISRVTDPDDLARQVRSAARSR